MQIIEVKTKQHKKEFLQLPVRLYKNEKNWIRPLDKDIEAVFDPEKNKYFRHGECTRWLLADDNGKTIGRVAAFYNRRTAKKEKAGGMGFFECINDQKAAFKLFDTCKQWLAGKGMECMDGPVNFGERDRWWGLLVDGFTEPNYCMPYNFLYYKELFEAYGFKTYFKQFTYHRRIKEPLDKKIHEKGKRILENPDYSFRHIEMKKAEKYAEDFMEIYNKAWSKHSGISKMRKAQAIALMKSLKPVMDPEIVWFGYYKNEPIAFYIMLPEMNQIIKHLNGKFNLWAKLKFLWYKKTNACRKIFGVIFGVVPEHQQKGVDSAIVLKYAEYAHQPNYRYDEMELNWIGDFNPKMMRIVEQIGCKIHKTHITYRKLFDESKPFERMPEIK